jgi:hypothetical protein
MVSLRARFLQLVFKTPPPPAVCRATFFSRGDISSNAILRPSRQHSSRVLNGSTKYYTRVITNNMVDPKELFETTSAVAIGTRSRRVGDTRLHDYWTGRQGRVLRGKLGALLALLTVQLYLVVSHSSHPPTLS